MSGEKKKCRSYSLHLKLNVVKQYEPNVADFGYNALIKKRNVSALMVCEWH